MANTCFADYSTLRSRDLARYDNELLEAPEEEGQFDVLNDETFGNPIDDEFDWNEQTEKFAEAFDPEHADRHHGRHDDSGFNTAEKTYRTQEEYMEHSISQLMVDDDDPDPAVLKSKPIPKRPFSQQRQQNLDSLFGPASPPSLLDTEYLMSPTSKNIWGSPLSGFQQPPQQVNNIQSLFDFAKSASSDAPIASIHGPHSRSAPMVLPKAQTLEEIESSLLRKPRVLTAEELERQLRGESPSQPPSLPNGHPRPPAQFSVLPPNIGSPHTSQLPPQMMQGSTPSMKDIANGHRSPVIGTPGHMSTMQAVVASMGNTPQYRNRQSPVYMLMRRSPVPRSPTPPPMCANPQTPQMGVSFGFVTPYATPSQPRYIATPGRGLSQPIGIPCAIQGPSGSPYDSPQGVYNSPQGPYQSPHQQRMQLQGSFNEAYMNRNDNISNNYQSSPQMKPQYQQNEGTRIEQANSKEHRYHRYPYNQKYESRLEHSGQRKRGDEDVYAGLMTQKEKEWIIKIQLLQLQTDNPFVDDYYYASWCMRKKAKELEKNAEDETDPKLLIPALARLENRAYKPAHFEGSLGRLTTSSVHNPRQIIDLLAKSVSEISPSASKSTSNVGKELRKSRQLFMDIEKGYNLLLDIDTLEKQILALPEDMRRPLLEERELRVDLLFHYLLCDGNSAAFMQYMNVRKGRSLTKRALPYLDKVQSVGIVSLVCKNLQQLMKNDQADERLEELFLPCAKVIATCNLATVVMYVEDIQHEDSPSTTKPIAMALQNKFGSSMLSTMIHQGEVIYNTTSPVDLDSNLQNEWCEFVHDFAGIMATIPLESIVAPLQMYADISKHLERLLNKRLMAVVEDNLKVFTHPAVIHES